MFPELVDFYEQNGHARPDPYDHPDLHRWTKQLRSNYRHQLLNPDNPDTQHRPKLKESKLQLLQELEFDWMGEEATNGSFAVHKKTKWDDMIPQLQAFYKEHGHSHPDAETNPELYRWTQQLLNNYRHQFLNEKSDKMVDPSRPRLSAAKMKTLKKLKFDWHRTPAKQGWDDMFPQLQLFYQENGHIQVDRNEQPELHRWIQRMRSNYRHKYLGIDDPSRPRIKHEKFLQLREMGLWENDKRILSKSFSLGRCRSSSADTTKKTVTKKAKTSVRSTRRKVKRWDDMIPKLQAYYDKYGHTNVNRMEYPELHGWAQSIRTTYRHQYFNTTTASQPRLAEYKFQKLQSLKFDWNYRNGSSRWENMFPQMKAFYEKHGHSHPDRIKDPKLYQWAQRMRSSYRQGILADSYVRQLEALSFAWDLHTARWEQRFEELCSFQQEFGHPHPTSLQNRRLYVFVQNQRREYKRLVLGEKSTLTEDRYERLVAIGLEWYRSHERAWETRYEELLDYIEEHGHCSVPCGWDDNYQLGLWCMNQRTAYRLFQRGEKTAMTEDRIKLLDEVAFIWNRQDANWKYMYQRLKEFQEQHGDYKIPTNDWENADLRLWLIRQRHLYNSQSNRLTKERMELLEGLPKFSWKGRSGGPTKEDWSKLFAGIREKGIQPGMRPKMHWFEGINPFEQEVKSTWTEDELVALWNEEAEDDEEFDLEMDDNNYYESPVEEELP